MYRIIIFLLLYYISNKGLFEECGTVKNLEVTGAATNSR